MVLGVFAFSGLTRGFLSVVCYSAGCGAFETAKGKVQAAFVLNVVSTLVIFVTAPLNLTVIPSGSTLEPS